MVQYNELIKALGDVIRRQRKSKNWTLDRMSSRADVSLSFLSQVENNTAVPSIEYLNKICSVLELPLSHLFALAEFHCRLSGMEKDALSTLPNSGVSS